jgi:hypothetical protein
MILRLSDPIDRHDARDARDDAIEARVRVIAWAFGVHIRGV